MLCAREAKPLLQRQHAETDPKGEFPYDPDWDRLFGWAEMGALNIWTVRAGEMLIGFASVLFMPHLYSRDISMANVHAPYLMPEWRLGWLGGELLETLLDALREHHVDVVDFDIDDSSRMHRILDRLGFARPEVRRRKWLNEQRPLASE